MASKHSVRSKTESDIRILLVGRTGHGKSSAGNTITGQTSFVVTEASTSETKTCNLSRKCKRLGRIVEVVDTPGIFDTDQDNHMVYKEMIKATALTTPGFHAIAFVLMRGKFTEELQKTQDLFFDCFGQGVEKFAFVILTDTDNNDARDRYLNFKPHPKLTHMIQKCNRRVVSLNNHSSTVLKDGQVEDIFKVIEEIKSSNGNKCFTNVAYKLTEAYVRNKRSLELSHDSLRILFEVKKQVKRADGQVENIPGVFASKDTCDECNAEMNCFDTIPNTSDDNEDFTHNRGNLRLYDNKTNEPLLGDSLQANQSKQKRTRCFAERELDPYPTSVSNFSDCHLRDEVPGKIVEMTDFVDTEDKVDNGPAGLMTWSFGSQQTNVENTVEEQKELGKKPIDRNDETHQQTRQEQVNRRSRGSRANRVVDLNSVHFDAVIKKPGKQSSRANRVVDLESVRYDPVIQIAEEAEENVNVQDHVTSQHSRVNRTVNITSVEVDAFNQFKNDVNEDDSILDKFIAFLKRAWMYCKGLLA